MDKPQICEKLNSLIDDLRDSGYESLALILESFATIFETTSKD